MTTDEKNLLDMAYFAVTVQRESGKSKTADLFADLAIALEGAIEDRDRHAAEVKRLQGFLMAFGPAMRKEAAR